MKKLFALIAFGVIFSATAAEAPERICILGSCSGTEPIAGRHHTSWLLETKGKLYQFDAGESCAYTAVTNKFDLLNLRAIFISHPHFDHVGGLAHIFWTRNKLVRRQQRQPVVSPLPVYAPVPSQIKDIIASLSYSGVIQKAEIHQTLQGVVYDDGTIKVEALRNRHCKPLSDGTWRSYSYKISANGKKIVFSGDMRSIDELDPFLGDCDILLVETGHHRPWEIAARIRTNTKWRVGKLVFIHHGRDYLNFPAETTAKTAKAWGEPPIFATDAMIIELK